MKLKNVISVVVLAVCAGTAAIATATPTIVFVDMRMGMSQSVEAKDKMESLKSTLARDEADLVTLQKQIKRLEENYSKESLTMSQDQARKVQKEIEDKKIEFNFLGKKLQKKANDAQQELMNELLPKFQKAVKSVMDENGYDVILRREAALLLEPKYDITEKVIKKLNSMK